MLMTSYDTSAGYRGLRQLFELGEEHAGFALFIHNGYFGPGAMSFTSRIGPCNFVFLLAERAINHFSFFAEF